jgi:hypothetical protein
MVQRLGFAAPHSASGTQAFWFLCSWCEDGVWGFVCLLSAAENACAWPRDGMFPAASRACQAVVAGGMCRRVPGML